MRLGFLNKTSHIHEQTIHQQSRIKSQIAEKTTNKSLIKTKSSSKSGKTKKLATKIFGYKTTYSSNRDETCIITRDKPLNKQKWQQ